MKVVFTRVAASELAALLDYIAERSPQGHRSVQARILERIALLSEQPHSDRTTASKRFRRVVVTPYPYAIFYRVVGDTVEIVGLRHAARRVPRIWR